MPLDLAISVGDGCVGLAHSVTQAALRPAAAAVLEAPAAQHASPCSSFRTEQGVVLTRGPVADRLHLPSRFKASFDLGVVRVTRHEVHHLDTPTTNSPNWMAARAALTSERAVLSVRLEEVFSDGYTPSRPVVGFVGLSQIVVARLVAQRAAVRVVHRVEEQGAVRLEEVFSGDTRQTSRWVCRVVSDRSCPIGGPAVRVVHRVESRVRCGGSTDKRRLSAGTKMSSSYPHARPPPVFFFLVTKRDRSEVHDKLLWVLVPMVMSHALQTPLLRTYDVLFRFAR